MLAPCPGAGWQCAWAWEAETRSRMRLLSPGVEGRFPGCLSTTQTLRTYPLFSSLTPSVQYPGREGRTPHTVLAHPSTLAEAIDKSRSALFSRVHTEYPSASWDSTADPAKVLGESLAHGVGAPWLPWPPGSAGDWRLRSHHATAALAWSRVGRDAVLARRPRLGLARSG